MKQSRLMSWVETLGGTALGFVISIGVQYGVCWHYSLPLTLSDNLGIIAVFTVASIIRGYGWRRLMEATGVRMKLSPFMQAVIVERARQISGEGWTIEHDDDHAPGELANAGAAYALNARRTSVSGPGRADRAPECWPWDETWWNPKDVRRDLVRGCALVVAEGERFDRLRKSRRTVEPSLTDDSSRVLAQAVSPIELAHNKTPSLQGGSSA